MTEHSERSREVSVQVALWVSNDGDIDPAHNDRIAFVAARKAADSLTDLADYVTTLIRQAAPSSAAAQVRDELAPNDYDRIDRALVAAELEAD